MSLIDDDLKKRCLRRGCTGKKPGSFHSRRLFLSLSPQSENPIPEPHFLMSHLRQEKQKSGRLRSFSLPLCDSQVKSDNREIPPEKERVDDETKAAAAVKLSALRHLCSGTLKKDQWSARVKSGGSKMSN